MLLNDHGLALAAVGTGAGWVKRKLTLTHPDPPTRVKAREFIREIIDFAGRFHAPAIIGSMQGRSLDGAASTPDRAAAISADALECCSASTPSHAMASADLRAAQSLRDQPGQHARARVQAAPVVVDDERRAAGRPVPHEHRGDPASADAIRAAGPHIGHVHFVDSNRRAAGFGHIDFAPIAQALHDDRLSPGSPRPRPSRWPDSDTAAAQTIHAFRRHLPGR